MSPRPPKQARRQIRTILIVGEGRAENVWLEYLKQLYYKRGCGFSIKLGNAHGKGAAHVIDHAIRQQRQIAYDLVAVLFDTDKDWDAGVRKHAEDHGLLLLPCDPCLEAELLRIKTHQEVRGSTAQIKQQFLQRYQEEAHRIDYSQHFPAGILDQIAGEKSSLKTLIELMKTGKS